ncbi:MAG: ATP-grasp domain-containing protein [Pseudomonadota bacterium]|nr:ATP-grasp domain-containing protein [Pseudomonadota bacterium]
MCLTRNARRKAPRLLLITPPNSYRTVSYLEAARRRGIPALVASEGRFSLVSEIADGLHINLEDPAALERLLEADQAQPFAGVVATDDACVELGSRIARALDLPHNPPQAARYSRRKDLSRQVLATAGVPVPRFRVIDLRQPLAPQLELLDYPCVVKPVSLAASRGVMRADDPEAALSVCKRVQRIITTESTTESFALTRLLIETFVAGPEVALEGLLHKGKLDVLALFDKPDPLEGPCFEETYYITPSRHTERVRARIVRRVEAACHALGLLEGPVHAEVRISEGDGVIMEVASRTIGGDCARLLRFGTGQGLEDLVVSHAVGNPLPVSAPEGGAGVLMIPINKAGILRRIEGITQARAVPYVEDILIAIREGYELVPLPEGGSYLGFMFSRAPTPAQAEAALREAHAKLKIVVAPVMTLTDERGK